MKYIENREIIFIMPKIYKRRVQIKRKKPSKPNKTSKTKKTNKTSKTKKTKKTKKTNQKKYYTLADVQKHNTLRDAWTIIHNKVYHIPYQWITVDHPGGRIIEKAIGRDATEMFDAIGHSAIAKKKLATFFIGYLK